MPDAVLKSEKEILMLTYIKVRGAARAGPMMLKTFPLPTHVKKLTIKSTVYYSEVPLDPLSWGQLEKQQHQQQQTKTNNNWENKKLLIFCLRSWPFSSLETDERQRQYYVYYN